MTYALCSAYLWFPCVTWSRPILTTTVLTQPQMLDKQYRIAWQYKYGLFPMLLRNTCILEDRHCRKISPQFGHICCLFGNMKLLPETHHLLLLMKLLLEIFSLRHIRWNSFFVVQKYLECQNRAYQHHDQNWNAPANIYLHFIPIVCNREDKKNNLLITDNNMLPAQSFRHYPSFEVF